MMLVRKPMHRTTTVIAAIALLLSTALVACSSADSESTSEDSGEVPCLGKCDSGVAEVPLLASCWVESEAFVCNVPDNEPLRTNELEVRIKDSDDPAPLTFRSDPLSTGPGVEGAVLADVSGSYPHHLQLVFDFNGSQPVTVARNQLPLELPLTLNNASDYTAETPLEIPLPFKFWAIELVNVAEYDAITFTMSPDVSLGDMLVRNGGEVQRELDMGWPLSIKAGAESTLVMLPVDGNALDDGTTAIELDVKIGDAFFDDIENPVEFQAEITAPGKYVISAEGLRPPTDEEQPLFGDPTIDPEDPNDPDPDPDPEPDPDPVDPPVECAEACASGEVCAQGECINRDNQVEWNDAVCDDDQNGDCRDDHVCVNKTCQVLERQVEWEDGLCDRDDDSDCRDDHICVDGTCQTTDNQVEWEDAICVNDDDSDCRDDHICVADTCQTLSNQVEWEDGICENNSDDDCYDNHVCVAGTCQSIGDQVPWEDADCDNEDSDCREGYVCSDAGKCVEP